MNVPGSLSITEKSTRTSSALAESYLSCIAVGVLAGVAVAELQTPLHWPGHKVVFWMIPVLASRIAARARAGATAGASAAAATTFALGGRLAGGVWLMPLVILAGALLDLAAQWVDRRAGSVRWWMPIFGLAGLAGNLVCFIKRLFDFAPAAFDRSGNFQELLSVAGSYAVFGLVAGLLGAGIGYAIRNSLRD
ncbi:MAG TPA: hypothetical protein VL992_02905 [Tepidisphaeraceae bacterium]|nr:hypothetical protein [Tepidisphaeraceae bacterium]